MVKLKGPSISLGAAGSLGGSLVFASNKGRAYAKKLTKPSQPQSAAQLGQRAITHWLSIRWAIIPSVLQAFWLPLAAEYDLPPYHAFLKYNLKRWSIYLAPTITYPPPSVQTAATFPTLSPVARLRTVLLTPGYTAANANLGFVIHHSLGTGFTPTKANAIACVTAIGALKETYIHGPLPSGTQYYRATPFTNGGWWGTPGAEESAVIP